MLQILESPNFWLALIIVLLYWLSYRFGNPFTGR
jgi:hypothetical protein